MEKFWKIDGRSMSSSNDIKTLKQRPMIRFKFGPKWTSTVQKMKKRNLPLRISSVNVAKSAVSCGFGHIYWRNP